MKSHVVLERGRRARRGQPRGPADENIRRRTRREVRDGSLNVRPAVREGDSLIYVSLAPGVARLLAVDVEREAEGVVVRCGPQRRAVELEAPAVARDPQQGDCFGPVVPRRRRIVCFDDVLRSSYF